MQVHELLDHFNTLANGWAYPADTVDTLKCGDPTMEITAIAVAWMSTAANLAEAVRLGCNMFVTHEPTFYDHFDRIDAQAALPGVIRKLAFIRQHNLAIYRCHDLWDRVRPFGIPDTWGESLGFANPIFADDWARVYAVAEQDAATIARTVADHLAPYGQGAVQLIGPATARVTRVATGTGAITPFLRFVTELGADLAICTDDGIDYWRDGAYAIDEGIPLVVVNHAVAEEKGVQRLALWLQEQLPAIPVHFLQGICLYTQISPSS